MKLYTAQINNPHTKGLAVDITAQSASTVIGRALAPLWSFLRPYKDGKIPWEAYSQLYHDHVAANWKRNELPFKVLCQQEEVTLMCYCNKSKYPRCHRYLAAGYLEDLCKFYNIPFEYGGEL